MTETTSRESDQSLLTLVNVTYALHGLGLALGAFGAASIVGSFVFGWPSIIAVVINYLKRDEARGTWLESHLTWQIRTFWFAMLWTIVVGTVSAVLAIVLVGFVTWAVGLTVLGIWAIYRIAKGWLALRDRRAIA
jgi:uncharacterized membrane protein